MYDQVKLSCTFTNYGVSETVLSPILDLYTCNSNLYNIILYPQNIILNQNDLGDISFNIDSYIYTT